LGPGNLNNLCGKLVLQRTQRLRFVPRSANVLQQNGEVAMVVKVFISHKKEDAEQASAISAYLVASGLQVYSFRSPRGLVTIDAATRENIHNSYLLRVEKQNGKLVNTVVETFGRVPALQPKKQ
jgi:hypothetical protein